MGYAAAAAVATSLNSRLAQAASLVVRFSNESFVRVFSIVGFYAHASL